MNATSHNTTVTRQFGPRAHAYLDSAVHAGGEDLAQMREVIGPRPQAIALDMGCGAGHAAFHLAPLVKQVVAYDLSDPMLAVVADEARRRGLDNIVTQQGAAEALPFSSAAFDVAVSRFSIHHWHDAPAGISEMRRVLKADGTAIFMDVLSPEIPLFDTWLQCLELLRDPSHVRNASLADWAQMLSSNGFAIDRVMKFRVRLAFAAWIERSQTPPIHVAAIRSLQQRAGADVRNYFAIEDDGSFTVDTVLIRAKAKTS